MTDGPHRSLKQSRAWKRAAEALSKPAFTQEEANQRTCDAIVKDFVKGDGHHLLKLTAEFRSENPQQTLFSDKEPFLDELRNQVTPNSLSDQFIRQLRNESTIEAALEAALKAETQSNLRSVEDHFLQAVQTGEARRGEVGYLRSRIAAALQQIDFSAVARKLLTPGSPHANKGRAPVNRVEEGPAIK